MKAFEWSSPGSVDEAVKLLAEIKPRDVNDAARPMSGGQDLLTTMKERILAPRRVVNLKTIEGLGGISLDPSSGLKIGALTKLHEIESHPVIVKSYPGLAEAAHSIATVQLRNMGTIGGNLCQRPRCWYFRLPHVVCLKKGGDTCYSEHGENKYNAILGGGPSFIVHPSDLATMLTALDATITIHGPKGVRVVPIGNFFILPEEDASRENVLEDAEIITQIQIPASGFAGRSTYLKFKERSSLDFAMGAAAAAVELGADKRVLQARLVLGAVAPIPWRVPQAEAVLIGKPLNDDTIGAAVEIALQGAAPLQHNAYKIPLSKTLLRRALNQLKSA
ncbi:MAG: xanthine dehydrogenase family protein subunit M [Tepidisphaeraceae bacterium]